MLMTDGKSIVTCEGSFHTSLLTYRLRGDGKEAA